MTERIKWIDGLKGLASVFIFLHHFILAFYPAMYYGSSVPSHLFSIDYLLADSPLMFFFGGHFLVCVFLMLSGIVLSIQSKKILTLKQLFITIIKRYFKLSIQLFVVSLIVYFMLKYQLFYNLQASEISFSPWLKMFYTTVSSIESVFTTSFFSVWFLGNDTYSTAFWMLHILFYGSLLITITNYLVNRKYINKYLTYFILIIYFIYTKSLILNLVLGMIVADYLNENTNKLNHVRYLLFFLAIILGAYPMGVIPSNFYRYFLFLPTYFSNTNFIHTLGSLLLILSITSFEKFKNVLSTDLFQMIGKYSYIIYLTHIPILFSVISYLFTQLILHSINYNIATLSVLIFIFTSFYLYLRKTK